MEDTLNILPGIYESGTGRSSKNRWVRGKNVRFVKALPQTLGGSVVINDGDPFRGICRSMLPNQTLEGIDYVALGTHSKIYINDGGNIDVTPIRDSGTLTDPFTTANGSAVVTVADTGHGLSAGDYVTFTGASAVGGITINGMYEVTSILDSDNYTVTHTVAAGSAATGGGSVGYDYEIPVGLADSQAGAGWGAGAFRAGGSYTDNRGWNDSEPGGGGAIIPARVVIFAPWGEDMMANPVGDTIYHFDASAGLTSSNRMTAISGAPATARFIMMAPNEKILIAFGAHDGSNDNPRNIRWCSREDFTDWVPTNINTAGDLLVSLGNALVTAATVNNVMLVLTDLAAYAMTEVGYPYIFDIEPIESKCGAISPGCLSVANGKAFWRGHSSYYEYDGAVRQLRCDVEETAFSINEQQSIKITSGVNSGFNEIWWFQPSADSTEIDTLIAYDYAQDIWWTGDIVRTAFVDLSEYSDTPLGARPDGLLMQHETGADEGSEVMRKVLKSWDSEANGGEDITYLNRLFPDFKEISGSAQLTITVKKRAQPRTSARTKGPFTVTSATSKTSVRIRGREVSVEIISEDLGDSWTLAPFGYDSKTIGKRAG